MPFLPPNQPRQSTEGKFFFALQYNTIKAFIMRTWIPPLYFLQARCPSCHPTYSVKALKALSLLFEYFTFDNFHLFLPMFFVCV